MLFTEIVVAVILAAAIGILFHLFKQPSIVGFIVAGLIVGSLGYLATEDIQIVQGLASIGVTLLLFIVGLEMNVRELKYIGRAAFFIGLGQVISTFALGFWVCHLLGFSTTVSFYTSIALTFSSTIVVVKLLSEKKDLRSLYGRIVLGALLTQDLIAILILIFLTGFKEEGGVTTGFIYTLIRGAIFIVALALISRYLNRFLDLISRSRELLFLFSIAWALGLAALAGSRFVGLSMEVGGFLAGLALASSSENFQISSKLRPLRDFFLILFFIGLGTNMIVGISSEIILPTVILSIFVLIGNPLIVMIYMGLMGYRSRTSFLAALNFAQVSEFSFVIMALGVRLGHLQSNNVSLITLTGLITISISSYFIYYSDKLYEFFKPGLKLFQRRTEFTEDIFEETNLKNHIVLIGAHRMGQTILRSLSDQAKEFMAVDFDPVVVKSLKEKGFPVFYGDITEEAIQELVGLDKASVVIATVPDFRDNLAVLEAVRRKQSKARLILNAESEPEARELYEMGADYVILPHFLGGRELINIIESDHGFGSLKKLRDRDLALINNSSFSDSN